MVWESGAPPTAPLRFTRSAGALGNAILGEAGNDDGGTRGAEGRGGAPEAGALDGLLEGCDILVTARRDFYSYGVLEGRGVQSRARWLPPSGAQGERMADIQ